MRKSGTVDFCIQFRLIAARFLFQEHAVSHICSRLVPFREVQDQINEYLVRIKSDDTTDS